MKMHLQRHPKPSQKRHHMPRRPQDGLQAEKKTTAGRPKTPLQLIASLTVSKQSKPRSCATFVAERVNAPRGGNPPRPIGLKHVDPELANLNPHFLGRGLPLPYPSPAPLSRLSVPVLESPISSNKNLKMRPLSRIRHIRGQQPSGFFYILESQMR